MAWSKRQDGEAKRGQDAIVTFTLPGNLESYTFEYTARRGRRATYAIKVLDANITAVHDSGFTTVSVALSSTDTLVNVARYNHDLWRIGSGTRYQLAEGELDVQWSAMDPG